jgi:filamentous hemagglutinin family protein
MSFQKRVSIGFFAAAGCVLFPVSWVETKPTGFHLKAGEALPPVFENGRFVIRTGHRAVIDWEAFSIALKESVHFEQAARESAVLNTVRGKERSALLGELSSNGAVFLINPNGILIGEEARIQTAGFVASTLDLLGEDLSAGVQTFKGTSQEGIVHQGLIHCNVGDVFLIGKTVESSGEIHTPQGRQGLLAGCEALILPREAPSMHVRSDEPVDVETLRENPYALAIRQTGLNRGQEIYCISEEGLSEIAGDITAQKEDKGGHVELLGCAVHLLDTARVNASGESGGGEILIGGDYQGKNPKVGNANYVWTGPKAQVNADAIKEGPGGKVIFWGNQQNHYYGTTSARGGALGGDGGFVEVSGAYLNFRGIADRSAPHGQAGLLLLDPSDITISTASTSNMDLTAGTWSGTANTCVLNTTDLQTSLASGNTIVTTVSGSTAVGTITVSNPVTWSAATTLTLIATRNILINANISNTNSGGTPFTAMDFTAQGTGTGTNVSGINVASAVTVSSNRGNIVMAGISPGATGTGNAGILVTGTVTVVGEGYLQMTGTGGTSTANENSGIVVRGTLSSTSTALESSGNPAIRLTGRGRGSAAGSGSGNMGIRLEGTASRINFTAAGDSVFVGTGGTGTGGTHCGIEIQGGIGVSSGTSRFSGAGGVDTDVGSGNVGVQLTGTNAVTALITGAVIFENCIGGGSTGANPSGANHGCYMVTTQSMLGGVTFSNCLGGVASVTATGSRGLYMNGGLTATGTGSTRSGIIATNCVGGKANGGAASSASPGIETVIGVYSVTGSFAGISLQGVGGGNSGGSDTGGSQVGIRLGAGPTNLNGTGGITLVGTGGFGTAGSNYGVYVNGITGAAGTVNGPIDITGVAGSNTTVGVFNESNGQIRTTTTSGGNITINAGAGNTISLAGTSPSGCLQTAAGAITLNGTTAIGSASSVLVTTSAGSITFANQLNLVTGTASVSYTGSGGGDLTFGGIIDGTRTLNLTHVGTGNIRLQGDVGPVNRVNILWTGTNSTLQLGGTSSGIQVVTNAFSIGMPVNLVGGASTINVNAGNIMFTKPVNGAQGLTLQSSGTTVTLGANIGNTTPIGAFTVATAGSVAMSAPTNTISASQVSISVPVTILTTGTCTITTSAPAGITFGSTVNANVAGASSLNLTAPSGAITFSGTVGGTARLASFVVTSASSLALANNLTLTTIIIPASVPTTLSKVGTTTITGVTLGTFSLGGAILGTSSNQQALTISNGGSAVTFGGNIGLVGTPLGSLSITGTGALGFGSGMSTVYAQNFSAAGPTTLNGASLAINTSGVSGISFQRISGVSARAQALTLSPGANPISLNNQVGTEAVPLGPLVFTNASDITTSILGINAASITQSNGSGTSSFIGTVETSAVSGGDISLNGTNFLFSQPVITTGDVSIAMTSGTLSIGSDCSMVLQGGFSQTGGTAVDLAGTIETVNGDIAFQSPITLSGSIAPTLIAEGSPANISFASTIDGACDFVVEADENVTFNDEVGSGASLVSLQVAAGGDITMSGNQTVSTGPMIYVGRILPTTSIQLTDNGTEPMRLFTSSSAESILGNFNVTLRAIEASVEVEGDIDLSGTVSLDIGGTLNIVGKTGITLEGEVNAQGAEDGHGGEVILSSSDGSITVYNIDTSGGEGSTNGGDITLHPSSGTQAGYPMGFITLQGNLIANPSGGTLPSANVGGTITLSSNRSLRPPVATIISGSAGNDVFISGENIIVGPNEAMTILGNLQLAGATAIELSDTVALLALGIATPILNLNLHGPYNILDNTGNLYSTPSLHFYGGTGYVNSASSIIPPEGPLDAQNLNYAPSVFSPLLVYQSYILNYDTTDRPPSGNTFPPELLQLFFYQLAVADAQLTDLLPFFGVGLAPPYKLCFQPAKDKPVECSKN